MTLLLVLQEVLLELFGHAAQPTGLLDKWGGRSLVEQLERGALTNQQFYEAVVEASGELRRVDGDCLHSLRSGCSQLLATDCCPAARHAGLQVDYATFAQLYADIFTAIPPMIAQQQLLAIEGVPTYLLSNCSGLHIDDVRRRHPFMASFAGLCLSYEVRWAYGRCLAHHALHGPNLIHGQHQPGALLMLLPECRAQVCSFKPDPAIYEAAEHLAGLQGADLAFIDDRADNAAAAAARGWQAIHHTSPQGTLRQLQALGLPVVEA